MKDPYTLTFEKMQEIGILDNAGSLMVHEYAKLESKPYMNLSIDVLAITKTEYRISMAHNGTQNGDNMADPDMEIRIYPGQKQAEALTFQNDYMGIYQEVYPEPGKVNPKLKTDLNKFLNTWLSNLIDQGFRMQAPAPVQP